MEIGKVCLVSQTNQVEPELGTAQHQLVLTYLNKFILMNQQLFITSLHHQVHHPHLGPQFILFLVLILYMFFHGPLAKQGIWARSNSFPVSGSGQTTKKLKGFVDKTDSAHVHKTEGLILNVEG